MLSKSLLNFIIIICRLWLYFCSRLLKRFYCYRNVMKGPPGDSNAPFQGQGTHTLPHQHHYQKQHQQQHATLPRASVIQDMNTQTQVKQICF